MAYFLFLREPYENTPSDPILTFFRRKGFAVDTSGAGDYVRGELIVTFSGRGRKVGIISPNLADLSEIVRGLQPQRILNTLGKDVSDQFDSNGNYMQA